MLKKTLLDMKIIRWFLLVPIVAIWILLPMVSGYYMTAFDPQGVDVQVFTQLQIFIPLAAPIPTIFFLRSYIENDGHEVLYTFPAVRKRNYVSVLLFFLLHLLMTVPIFIWYEIIYGNIWYEFLRAAIQSFFFCSLAFALVYIARSTLTALIGTLIINAGMLMAAKDLPMQGDWIGEINVFSRIVFGDARPIEPLRYTLVFAVSVVLFAVAVWRSREYMR